MAYFGGRMVPGGSKIQGVDTGVDGWTGEEGAQEIRRPNLQEGAQLWQEGGVRLF